MRPASITPQSWVPLAAASILFGVSLLWAYSATMAEIVRKWEADPQYSHGYLVPVFAGALLWLRRESFPRDQLRPSLLGVAALAVALLLRHASTYYYVVWFEQLSLIACVPAIVLMLGGWAGLRWSWPACLFLVFMIPLPYTLEVALRDPLRGIGTVVSTYVMQTVGLPAYSEGTVIVVGDKQIGVAEACSGLRMLMIFFALATATAMVGDQPLWRRCLMVVSAVPIAIFSNVIRITATGSLYAFGYDRFADLVFHDLAGYLMMVLALLLLWGEWALLDRLILVEAEEPTRMSAALLSPRLSSPMNGDSHSDSSASARASRPSSTALH